MSIKSVTHNELKFDLKLYSDDVYMLLRNECGLPCEHHTLYQVGLDNAQQDNGDLLFQGAFWIKAVEEDVLLSADDLDAILRKKYEIPTESSYEIRLRARLTMEDSQEELPPHVELHGSFYMTLHWTELLSSTAT